MSTLVSEAKNTAKEKAKAMLLDMGAPLRQGIMDGIKDVLQASVVEDPDMWTCVKDLASKMVSLMWDHISLEVERTIESSLVKYQDDSLKEGPVAEGCLLRLWCRFRAFILHHWIPHNKSVFGKVQDPVYLIIFVLTLLPIPGLRALVFAILLAMLLFPGPPDTHQLMHFVISFKTTQFLSIGFTLVILSSFTYLMCYTVRKDDVAGCVDSLVHSTPLWIKVFDYLCNVFLPWSALVLLHWSERRERRRLMRSRKLTALGMAATPRATPQDDALASQQAPIGGSLRRMFIYDMVCFALTLLILSLVSWRTSGLNFESPEFMANMLWTEIFYSVCMLPFLIFKIPLLFSVITHGDPTGFNRNGACVAWAIPPIRKTKKAMREKFKDWRRDVKHITRSKRAGGEKAPEEVEGQRGDFTWGLWYAMMEGTLDAGAEEAPVVMAAEPHLLLNAYDRF
jgi:hypothetical protein